MAYVQHSQTPLSSVASAFGRVLAAFTTVSDSIVQDRRQAVAALESKSDDDLSRMGLTRDQIAQDVHRHLFYS